MQSGVGVTRSASGGFWCRGARYASGFAVALAVWLGGLVLLVAFGAMVDRFHVVAYGAGDWSKAIAELEAALPATVRIGGSRAQTDLVEFTLLRACAGVGMVGETPGRNSISAAALLAPDGDPGSSTMRNEAPSRSCMVRGTGQPRAAR